MAKCRVRLRSTYNLVVNSGLIKALEIIFESTNGTKIRYGSDS